MYRRNDRIDPSRTLPIQNALIKDLNKRFKLLINDIKEGVIQRDILAISPTIVSYTTPGPRAFNFARSQDKVEAFMKWFRQQSKKRLLESGIAPQIGTGVEAAWTNMYVTDTYKRGVIRARYELDKAGYDVPALDAANEQAISTTLSLPMHVDRLGVLYARVFEELQGITTAMDTVISRILTQGIADGDGPRLLARKLIAGINGAGIGDLGMTDSLGRFIPAARRAEIMARTEILRAHHLATIQEYRNYGAAGVNVLAEWATAGDDRVCSKCAELQGRMYSLDEAERLIPAHPQCRCICLPAIININARRPAFRRLAS